MSQSKGYLIVGQGIAGSLLAFKLLERGHRIMMVDDNHQSSSTRVSAGIFNPITGKRLALTPQFDIYFAQATATYQQLKDQFGITIFTPTPLVRILLNEAEAQRCQALNKDSQVGKYIKAIYPSGKFHRLLKDPYGTIEFKNAGYCAAPALLATLRNYFKTQGVLREAVFDYQDITITDTGVCWQGNTFDKIICCEGFQAMHNPWLEHMPFNHVKGEILTLRFEGDPLPEVIFNQKVWCVPSGNNIFLAGATYDREHIDLTPTLDGEHAIVNGLKEFINANVTVLKHQVGVRPVIIDTMPIVGGLLKQPRVVIFNGFASKGFLMTPFYAEVLIEYLTKGNDIPRAVNVNRFKQI